MSPLGIFANRVLFVGLLAWLIAQTIKLPLEYLHTHRWNWSLLISTGGMPSSHSALVVATTLAIGLFYGFDHPMFALGVAVTMVVTYDATNIRRQAGIHAQKINFIIEEMFSGQPITEEQLKEVLGHTPLEVAGGIVLGSAVAVLAWFFSR
jgi:hypothetical protein